MTFEFRIQESVVGQIAHVGILTLAVACGGGGGGGSGGDGDGRPRENTGATCEAPADCFTDIDTGKLAGEPLCLDRVRDGYCTHRCQNDDDCCAVEGECRSEFRQVCAPFESTGDKMCFLSCEAEDRPPAPDGEGKLGEQIFCQREVGADFICRSTGGGRQNRKVCVPGDCGVGASCRDAEDCDPELECMTDVQGGYCTVPNCQGDADCPGSSVCVERNGGNTICASTCPEGAADCSFCRGKDIAATCTSDVELVEASSVRVCVP